MDLSSGLAKYSSIASVHNGENPAPGELLKVEMRGSTGGDLLKEGEGVNTRGGVGEEQDADLGISGGYLSRQSEREHCGANGSSEDLRLLNDFPSSGRGFRATFPFPVRARTFGLFKFRPSKPSQRSPQRFAE